MTRTLIVAAACTAIIVITLTVWLVSNGGGEQESAREFLGAPRQLDTTGGQEMRPRWSDGEGQGDEAIEN